MNAPPRGDAGSLGGPFLLYWTNSAQNDKVRNYGEKSN